MKLKLNLLAGALIAGSLTISTWAQGDAVQLAAQSTKAPATDPAAVNGTVSDSWNGIKDYGYEQRDAFAAGLARMAGKLDGEVREMNAKLTGLPDTVAKERDRMNKEFSEAHAYLKSLLSGLRTGTADTWDSAKGKVVQSWESEQAAYAKIKSSPTS